MKKIVFFILVSTLNSFAQNANWGTGLPVNVTVNGSSLDLSVFDPILNQTRTTSISVGSNPTYKNSDGVVVGYGSYGNMEYATYDLDLHAWKTGGTQIGTSNSTGTILTSDGVVVGFGSLGNMNYSIYDIALQAWKTGGTQISTSNSGTILTSDGVVVGFGSLGNMNYASYDIELQAWKTGGTQISISNSGTIFTSDGLVVGFGTLGNMNYAIYDFNLDSWKTGGLQLGSSGNISLSSGTITYSGFSSGILGYNFNTQSWGSYNTTPTCKFLPVTFPGSSWVFMRCMSIGAGTFTYSCGDGHQIYRKQGWKKYNGINSYNASLNVSNGVNNSTCTATINITVGIAEHTNLDFQIFPNPTNLNSNLTVTSEEKISEIKIYNTLGERIYVENDVNAQTSYIHLNSNIFSKGMYFVELLTGDHRRGIQKIIIQ